MTNTPTPWRIEKFSGEAYTEGEVDFRLVGANNVSPAILFGSFPTNPELEANKEFVIKAVNSYEAMRRALLPFAEQPVGEGLSCHAGLVSMQECGRCSKILAARAALAPEDA